MYTPITLFVYKRLWHTQQTIESLQRNELAADSDVIIYSEAPKDKDSSQGVQQVRDYIHTVGGFRSVRIIEREKNYGLANSIITGVSDVITEHGRVIVLEDDMVTSRYFLRYMNDALNLYQNEERVISIHGYIYPETSKGHETFFLKGADCWGWATWKRGWNLFEPDGQKLLTELRVRNLTHKFDFDDSYGYSDMLEDQVNGKTDSWAIRWYAAAFLQDKLTLYPGRYLVRNIGLDGSGTNCGTTNTFDTSLADSPIRVKRIRVKENQRCRRAFSRYFKPSEVGFIESTTEKLRSIFHVY